jgi:hypothetical protein
MCAEPRRVRAHGQALVELLVALIALLPLFFGMAWLAKVLDLQQATIAGARALAFECTVRLDACRDADGHPELAAETRRRFFAAHRLGLRSDDAAPGVPGVAERNAMWVDRGGQSLLERFEDVTVSVGPARFDSPLAFAAGQGAADLVSRLGGPGRFGLQLDGGFVEARVETVVSRSAPADGWVSRLMAMPLSLGARLTVLSDAWNASGPYGEAADSVETRVAAGARLPVADPLIDAGWLGVRGLLAVADFLQVEPSASSLRWHEVDVDLVPPDRLGGGGAPAVPAEPLPDRP